MYNLILKEFWYKIFTETKIRNLSLLEIENIAKKIAIKEVDRYQLSKDEKNEIYDKLISINFEQFLRNY